MTAHTDLQRLALANGGRIPAQVPAHYVRWAFAVHRRARGHVVPAVERPAPAVIRLA